MGAPMGTGMRASGEQGQGTYEGQGGTYQGQGGQAGQGANNY